MATGKVDSKFGSAIETGQAEEITAFTLRQEHIELVGFHCHVGSQVFAEDIFERAAVIMLEFVADMKKKYNYLARQLDLGGGYGVRYVDSDPYLDVDKKVGEVATAIKETCQRLGIEMPDIHGARPQHRGQRRYDPLHRRHASEDPRLQELCVHRRRYAR